MHPSVYCRRAREVSFRRCHLSIHLLLLFPLDEPPGSGAIVPAMRFLQRPLLSIPQKIALSITKGMAEVFRDALCRIFFMHRWGELWDREL
jgi:hypothetical protein